MTGAAGRRRLIEWPQANPRRKGHHVIKDLLASSFALAQH
jgi:hypothetical protein